MTCGGGQAHTRVQCILLLLGIGPDIEIVAPAALRDRLRELAEQVLMRAR